MARDTFSSNTNSINMGGTETLFLLFARAARATRYLRKQKRQQHKHFRIKNGLVEYVDENIWYDQSYETS